MRGDRARRIHLAHLLPFGGASQPEKLVEQAGLPQGDLAVVGVQIQGAALVACVGGRVAVVHGDRYAVLLKDAGAGQPARSGSDDADPGMSGVRRSHVFVLR